MSLWIEEHGSSFDVPHEITSAEGIEDLSYRNDVCPRFGISIPDHQTEVVVWCDHPEEDSRENFGNARFSVQVVCDAYDRNVWEALTLAMGHEPYDFVSESEDPSEALTSLVSTLQLVRSILRNV